MLTQRATDSTSISPLPEACNDVYHCRTISSIILSCFSTIFLCTWVALHLDVPRDSYAPWWTKSGKRIGWMITALLAPEVVLFTAFEDWLESSENLKKILERHPECTWTAVHAHLLNMGGFQLVSEDGSTEILDEESFLDNIHKRHVDILKMPINEIQDKSKEDGIAKAIIVIQTLWFILQSVNRTAHGLLLTELELTTLAHTTINIFIYCCWWNKPQNVALPIDVYLKENPQVQHKDDSDERQVDDKGLLTARQPLPLSARLGVYINENLWQTGGYSDAFTWQTLAVIAMVFVIGAIFGGIHCFAWYSPFPTFIERTLWRISAIIITAGPIVLLTSLLLIGSSNIAEWLQITFFLLLLTAYILARTCLLVLALLSLRALPYGAYQTLPWTTYIPHI